MDALVNADAQGTPGDVLAVRPSCVGKGRFVLPHVKLIAKSERVPHVF